VYHPCFGVLGGGDGRAGKVEKDGKAIFPKGKIILQPGETLTIETPGGGGWGEPDARSPELVAQDRREGLATAASHSSKLA
jgi:N-methylhydantoinase B